ncbi:MAG: type II secretion system F family protein [Candidatus Aureabacteria bacterium]|nr:type II secretion system F family protein [Candidatus Auribacterota bacterium]
MVSRKEQFVFFSELSTLLEAGIPILRAVETLENSPGIKGNFHKTLSLIRFDIGRGSSFSESSSRRKAFPQLFLNLLSAGEKSGKLPEIARKISSFIQRELTFQKRITGALIYPLFLLHFAIIAPPLYLIFSQGFLSYVLFVTKTLSALYLVVVLCWFLYKTLSTLDPFSLSFNYILLKIPILGKIIKSFSLYRFYISFYYLYDAGYDLRRSFMESAHFISHKGLKHSLEPILRKIGQNMPLEDALSQNSLIPLTDTNLLTAGEKTGSLDKTLLQLLSIYSEKIEMQLELIEKLLPKLVFFGIALFVAWKVISFWVGYFDKLTGYL